MKLKDLVVRFIPLIKPKKALNHGVHSEHGDKTKAYVDFVIHPLGGVEIPLTPRFSAVLAVFAVVELKF